MRKPVCEWLVSQGMTPVFEVYTVHACDLVGVEFADRVGRKMPPIKNVVAIELKLDNVAEVIRQCVTNKSVIPLVYAAMPKERCENMRLAGRKQFLLAGVGLLAVSDKVEIVCPAIYKPTTEPVPFTGRNMGKKLWSRRGEWENRLAEWERNNPNQTTKKAA